MRTYLLNNQTPSLKQGEFNSSSVGIIVPEDMRAYTLFLVFGLPSGTKVFTPALLIDTNFMVVYALPATVLSEIGRVQVELQGYKTGSYIKSITFNFSVVQSLTGPTNGTGSELKQVDYLPWYTEAAGFKEEVELIANAYKLDEALRISKEIARVAGESARIIAENNRVTGENTRVANEAIRVPSESGRVSAESGRVTAESGRVTAESGRVTAESGRAAALALKADKIRATNLITNGDFTNDTSGWVASNCSLMAENGVLKITANGANAYPMGQTKPSFPSLVDDIYYYRTKGRLVTPYTGTAYLGVNLQGCPTKLITNPTPGQWYENSYRDTNTTYRANTLFFCYGQFSTTAEALNKIVEFDKIIIINLTATFGAGNEPTKEQMDNLLLKYPNSWFDGTVDLVNVSDLMNGKASKTQEGWITPTLYNGATTDPTNPIRYRKNQFGRVEFAGRIQTVTAGLVAFNIPSGYRMKSGSALSRIALIDTQGLARNATNNTSFYITPAVNGQWVSFDGVSYVAEE